MALLDFFSRLILREIHLKQKPQSIDEYLMNLFIDLLIQVLKMPDDMLSLLIQACTDDIDRREEIEKLIQNKITNKKERF